MSVIGYDTLIEVNDGASNAQTEITGVTNITFPSEKLNVVESKKLNASTRKIDKVATLVDPGEWSFDVEYNITMIQRLIALRVLSDAGTTSTFRITFPDLRRATFASFVTSLPLDPIVSDGILVVKPTLVVSGAVAWDTAS